MIEIFSYRYTMICVYSYEKESVRILKDNKKQVRYHLFLMRKS